MFVIGALPMVASAEQNSDDIVILYENDVHCEVAGVAAIAAAGLIFWRKKK